jgi:hypothetical protein
MDMKYDPNTMTPLDPDDFRLMCWYISKTELKLTKRELLDPSLKALTIVGTSDQQRQQIKSWCREMDGIRTFKTQIWEDQYGKGDVYFNYLNHEFAVLADETSIAGLTEWLGTLPRRGAAVLVKGMSRRSLGCQLKGKASKIIPSLDHSDVHVVSVCDPDLEFELELRRD